MDLGSDWYLLSGVPRSRHKRLFEAICSRQMPGLVITVSEQFSGRFVCLKPKKDSKH